MAIQKHHAFLLSAIITLGQSLPEGKNRTFLRVLYGRVYRNPGLVTLVKEIHTLGRNECRLAKKGLRPIVVDYVNQLPTEKTRRGAINFLKNSSRL